MAAPIETAGLEGILQALLFGGMPNASIAQSVPLLGGLPQSPSATPTLPGSPVDLRPKSEISSPLPSLSPEALATVLGGPIGGLPNPGSSPRGNFLP